MSDEENTVTNDTLPEIEFSSQIPLESALYFIMELDLLAEVLDQKASNLLTGDPTVNLIYSSIIMGNITMIQSLQMLFQDILAKNSLNEKMTDEQISSRLRELLAEFTSSAADRMGDQSANTRKNVKKGIFS